ncbi:PHP domain-containing protein [Candidatus Contubernalis alkaliaceticus]|uniref:PHP domain-containing protein n=1 Tax=Candidatus Contubernalis alkaliaceticus TaxID=338645 RepID=UPI001F4BD4FB|nr:PHP domain-containing protein [Candidatus Contubernalis alkalaceticus]UNC90787.1 PHP domain-containing protein [Candidatus Contubernalis alkalaceticus]
MELFADYHTHTRHSHGKGTVEDNVRAAIKRGLQEVAITDHGPANILVGIKSAKTLDKIQSEIEICQKKYPEIKILLGVEANIVSIDGDIDIPSPYIKKLDILLAGLHTGIISRDLKSGVNLIAKNWLSRFIDSLGAKMRYINTLAVIRAVERFPIDVVVHPGLKLNINTHVLAEVCSRRGTALEINSSHGQKSSNFVKSAAETKVKFVINSDAHSPEEVGRLEEGEKIARELKLDPARIINTKNNF